MKRLSTAEFGTTTVFLMVVGSAVYFAWLLIKGGGLVLAQAPRFLQGVAAIGILTMALLQLAKGLLRVRGRFQERVVKEWIQRGLRCMKQPSNSEGGLVKQTPEDRALENVPKVLKELRRLAVTNEKVDLFNLPIEQLCGQITAAAEPLLDYPEEKNKQNKSDDKEGDEEGQLASLVVCALAGNAGWKEAQSYDDQKKNYLNHKKSGVNAEENFLAFRNRLAHHFQRNIDGLQIEVTQRWRKILWVAALLLGTVMAGLGSLKLGTPEEKAFFTIVGGLSAGFMATVARDVVAMIERFRR